MRELVSTDVVLGADFTGPLVGGTPVAVSSNPGEDGTVKRSVTGLTPGTVYSYDQTWAAVNSEAQSGAWRVGLVCGACCVPTLPPSRSADTVRAATARPDMSVVSVNRRRT